MELQIRLLLNLILVAFLFPATIWGAQQETEKWQDTDFSILETDSDDFGSYSIGNNLSTNGRTLKKNQWSIGTLYIANGITDNFSLGTSLFVLQNFLMTNAMARYRFVLSSKENLSLDGAYFKTFGGKVFQGETDCYYHDTSQPMICEKQPDRVVGFQMEAINLKVTYSHQFARYYRFNTTASYFYYFDERMPFSFRMDPANSDPYTLNLTTLHEFKIWDQVYLNYELGLWGFNYQYPYIHTGAKFSIQSLDWLFGFGISTTFSPSFPAHLARNFMGYDSRQSVHPEFEVQYFF